MKTMKFAIVFVILGFSLNLCYADVVFKSKTGSASKENTKSEILEENADSNNKTENLETESLSSSSSDDVSALGNINEESLSSSDKNRASDNTNKPSLEGSPFVYDALLMTLTRLIPTKELCDVRLLKAFSKVPRLDFVPREYSKSAYLDQRIPLGNGRFLADPFSIAAALEALNLQETDRCLIVGDGSGYVCAIVRLLVGEVYSIDDSKVLNKRAKDVFKRLEYETHSLCQGNVEQGWKEKAPYDKIFFARSMNSLPNGFIEQLKDNGVLIAPIGDRYGQSLVLYQKKGEDAIQRNLRPILFEPLNEKILSDIDPAHPHLIGGDFEDSFASDIENSTTDNSNKESVETDDSQSEESISLPHKRMIPIGWRNIRNAYLEKSAEVYEGQGACVCDNWTVKEEQDKKDANAEQISAATLPEERTNATGNEKLMREQQRAEEQRCSLCQTFPIDPSVSKRLIFSGAYRIDRLETQDKNIALIKVEFFDREGKLCRSNGELVILQDNQSFAEWQEFEEEFSVPTRAVEATVTIGILDGLGTVRFDSLALRNKKDKRDN